MKAQVQLLFSMVLLLSACGSIETPTPLPEILPTPASVSSIESRVLSTLKIFKEPDEMVFLDGYLWTKTGDGHLIQIDPATTTVTADIKVDTTTDNYHYCQGLGTDGTHIWVCSAGGDLDIRTTDVMRVDPQSKSIIETIKIEKVFDQLDLPFLQNQIWVLTDNGNKLVGIDATTNETGNSMDLGMRCFQLTAASKFLFASCKLDNVVLQIDVESMQVVSQATLKNPGVIAGDENGIWVALDNSVVRLDSKNLNPVATFTNLPRVGSSGDIFVTNDSVWVRQEDNFIYHIDPATNQIIEQISVTEKIAGGSLLITSDTIWATAGDDNLLIKLSLK